MKSDERIEAALRRRPSDERDYEEPMAGLVSDEGIQRVRPVTRSRMRAGALPGVAGLALVLALAVGWAVVGLPRDRGVGGPSGAPQTGSGPTPGASQPLIGCWGASPGFSPNLLTGTGSAEAADTAAAGVLRKLISSPDASDAPANGWYLIEATPDEAQFMARVPNGGPSDYWQVVVKRGTAGQFVTDGWSLGGYGGCQLETVPPAGYGPATWTLDPSVPFTSGANELHILVSEQGCHGSNSTEVGRILASVAYTNRAVRVTVVARSPQGAQTCPMPPPTPYVVKLGQPVGSRDLQDGGPWPAKTIASGGQPIVTPTPTPYPSSWHQPMECSGTVDDVSFFKGASMSASFDVYCAVLPAGWSVNDRSPDGAVPLWVAYFGPNQELFELIEGPVCTTSEFASDCLLGTVVGSAAFGDRQGILRQAGDDFALNLDPTQDPSWVARGQGISLETFKALTAALIVVAK